MSKGIKRVFLKYKNEEYRASLRNGMSQALVQQNLDDEKGWEINPYTNTLYKIVVITEKFKIRLNIWEDKKQIQVLPMYESEEYREAIESFDSLPAKIDKEIANYHKQRRQVLETREKIKTYVEVIGIPKDQRGLCPIMSTIDEYVSEEEVEAICDKVEKKIKRRLGVWKTNVKG